MTKTKVAALLAASLAVLVAGIWLGTVLRPYLDRAAEVESMRRQWPMLLQLLQKHEAALIQGGLMKAETPDVVR